MNRVKVLSGTVENLTRQDRIEQLAKEKFDLHVPSPESLKIYLKD